jgi:hypothetical protein
MFAHHAKSPQWLSAEIYFSSSFTSEKHIARRSFGDYDNSCWPSLHHFGRTIFWKVQRIKGRTEKMVQNLSGDPQCPIEERA